MRALPQNARKGPAYTPEEDATICAMRQKGIGFKVIAEKMGRTKNSVSDRWQKLWASGRDGTLADVRPKPADVAPAIVTNGLLRDRPLRTCTVPLRTMVRDGKVTGMRV